MLRIGMTQVPSAPPPPDDLTSNVESNEGGSPDDSMDQNMDQDPNAKDEGSKINPANAGYQGPEEGPFECEHCTFWQDPNACTIVSGPIDPHGCCNNYTSGHHDHEADGVEEGDQESPAEDASEPAEEGVDNAEPDQVGS